MSAISLDPEQAAAAQHVQGPAIVLAGPGSGKTRVLVARIVHLIRNGLPPESHLVTTFSRKAAAEMRDRASRFLGAETAKRIPITTLHAFGFRVIREHPKLFRRERRVTLLDEKGALTLLRQCVAEQIGEMDAEAVGGLFELYSRYRNDGAVLPEPNDTRRDGMVEKLIEALDGTPFGQARALRCLIAYEAHKQRQNVLDFDDLCVLPARLLSRSEELGRRYARRFPFLSMDESQDTNRVQFQMIESIGRWHRNLFIVGDDDQLIYEWRGARMSNLHGFVNRFAPKRYRLERNYRSTPAIVEASVAHILNNRERLDKRPKAVSRQAGEPPRFMPFSDHYKMVSVLADMIRERLQDGVPPGDISVLYRVNRIAYLIEPQLRRLGIPYEVVGGTAFAQRQEIGAALAAVRLLVNPKDTSALQVVAQHVTGLGKKSVDQVVALMEQNGIAYDQVLRVEGLSPALERKLTDLRQRMVRLEALGPAKLADWCLDAASGIDVVRREKDPEMRERRIRNLALLQTMATDWDGYLELVLDDDGPTKDADRVVLSTIHRAKGKEWRTVFVVGVSEGILPSEKDDIEDARRVSYVAVTRAKRECFLLHSDKIVWGPKQVTRYRPSGFVDELNAASKTPARDPVDPVSDDGRHLKRFRNQLRKWQLK